MTSHPNPNHREIGEQPSGPFLTAAELQKRQYPHADGRAVIAAANRHRMGFLTVIDVAMIADDPQTRLQPVLIRCGACRLTAPAQDAQLLADIINADGRTYVRDLSIPVQS